MWGVVHAVAMGDILWCCTQIGKLIDEMCRKGKMGVLVTRKPSLGKELGRERVGQNE